MKLYDLKDEIFTVGSHQGFNATPEVLRRIVTNFNKLRQNFSVPIKLGHDEGQPITDGEPALGWVDRVELDNENAPTKVFAYYKDMPKIVFTAIKNKMYKSRSIELENQYRDGKVYENVLTGVALLGSTLPRVEKLADLGKYFASGADKPNDLHRYVIPVASGASVASTGKVRFSINTTENRGSIMTPEQIAQLQEDLRQSQAKLADSTAAVTELTGKVETFSRDDKARVAAEAAALVVNKRKEVTDLLEAAVKDERITPVNRDVFSKVLGIASDERVVAIEVADVEALIGKKKETFSRKSTATDEGTGAEEDEDASVTISKKVFSHMEKSGSTDFAKSTLIVMRANPQLATDYIESNGTKKE